MQLFNQIETLDLFGIKDRAIPNLERVVLRAKEDVNLTAYSLIVGMKIPNKGSIPLPNLFFWFGDGVIEKDVWLHVYTGKGSMQESIHPTTGDKIFSVFWGHSSILFSTESLFPILCKFDQLTIGESMWDESKARSIETSN